MLSSSANRLQAEASAEVPVDFPLRELRHINFRHLQILFGGLQARFAALICPSSAALKKPAPGRRNSSAPSRKLWATSLLALDGYLTGQSDWMVNYAERHRAGLPVGTALTERTANFPVNRRMNKSQQMLLDQTRRRPLAAGPLRPLQRNPRLRLRTENRSR
ncbi:MAG: hypothetical protein WA869_18545 [Alloacidobacterium sp.]